jgi:hypothetical protein
MDASLNKGSLKTIRLYEVDGNKLSLLGFVIVQAQDIIDDQEWQDDEIYEDMY